MSVSERGCLYVYSVYVDSPRVYVYTGFGNLHQMRSCRVCRIDKVHVVCMRDFTGIFQ